MEYVITIGLTLTLFCSIIGVVIKKNKNFYNKKIYRQSDMHNMLKKFFTLEINYNKNSSQLKKRKEKNSTKVIILDNKAYWVLDNIFYMGLAVNGEVDPNTATPVDTSKLSTTDINKLLFILDALKGGKSNDSGSTRNE